MWRRICLGTREGQGEEEGEGEEGEGGEGGGGAFLCGLPPPSQGVKQVQQGVARGWRRGGVSGRRANIALFAISRVIRGLFARYPRSSRVIRCVAYSLSE